MFTKHRYKYDHVSILHLYTIDIYIVESPCKQNKLLNVDCSTVTHNCNNAVKEKKIKISAQKCCRATQDSLLAKKIIIAESAKQQIKLPS